MQFKDIVGQQDVANRLTEIIDSGRVSHAQLILGRTAEGSMQLALAYLQYLCCEHRVHHAEGELRADSCGTCPQCKKIGSLMHPDLHFVFPNPPNGSQSVSSDDYMAQYLDFLKEYKGLGTLEEFNASLAGEVKTSIIRESDAANIVRTLGLKSYEGGWKMLVVWLPERMNASAANELLKTLEEPSEHTLILLVSEDAEHLLPTIRSRAQTVRLPVSDERPGMEMADQFGPMMVGWLRQLFKLKMKELAEQVETLAKMDRPQLSSSYDTPSASCANASCTALQAKRWSSAPATRNSTPCSPAWSPQTTSKQSTTRCPTRSLPSTATPTPR